MGDGENLDLNELEECIRDLSDVLSRLEVLKDYERFRSRVLSIAFTELEGAEMWLNRALGDYDEREFLKEAQP